MKIKLTDHPKDKRLNWLLLIFFLFAMATIGKGMYNQSHDLNQDHFLVPLVFFFFSVWFLIFAYAAFSRYKMMELVPVFYQLFDYILKKTTALNEEKRKYLLSRIFGFISLIIAIAMLSFAFIGYFKTF